MAALQVKPTRMELSNLKKKKKVAVRGHKLMKDKRDEMVRRFIIYVRRNKELREQVEENPRRRTAWPWRRPWSKARGSASS